MHVDQGQLPAEPTAYFRAAAGDHDAQVEMAHLILGQGMAGDMPIDDAISLALIWGHMAATSGRAGPLLAYAGLLLTQASRAHEFPGATDADFATALAIVEAVAEAGHHRAQVIAFALTAKVPPWVTAQAAQLKPQFAVQPLLETERDEDAAGLSNIIASVGAEAVGSC